MKLNRNTNNILLILFFIVLLVFSICISTKNTLIETNVNYGVNDCNSELQKVLNTKVDKGIIHTLENCIREYKAFTSNSATCNGYNIMKHHRFKDFCSGGHYNLGVYT